VEDEVHAIEREIDENQDELAVFQQEVRRSIADLRERLLRLERDVKRKKNKRGKQKFETTWEDDD
jgi:hypothetical protein